MIEINVFQLFKLFTMLSFLGTS